MTRDIRCDIERNCRVADCHGIGSVFVEFGTVVLDGAVFSPDLKILGELHIDGEIFSCILTNRFEEWVIRAAMTH